MAGPLSSSFCPSTSTVYLIDVKTTKSGQNHHFYFSSLINMSIICQHVHRLELRKFFLILRGALTG